MSNTNTTQNAFLEQYLRGTGKTLSVNEARKRFGIQNLRARMTEFRQAGLRVRVSEAKNGTARYAVSRDNVEGSKARTFS